MAGLFQKAILQSGNALISWSITYEPNKWAFEVGSTLGFNGDDPKELVKYLRTISVEDLVKTVIKILDDLLEVSFIHKYSVDFVAAVLLQ